MKKKYLFSAFTKPPKNPLSVIIKEHKNKDILYITYSNGPSNGGGTWGENVVSLNPRTLLFIEESFSPRVYASFKQVVLDRILYRISVDEKD
jgi:hypothetical protein